MPKRVPKRVPLEEPEMVAILESIARDGSDTARIQAIRVLRAIRQPREELPADDWSVIYGDSTVTPISSRKR